jgi:predicted nucleic acid-binding protein
MPVEYLTPTMEQRAVEVQMLLADQGKHRAPGIPELLIAANAERAGHTVLHLDKDFDSTKTLISSLKSPDSPPNVSKSPERICETVRPTGQFC